MSASRAHILDEIRRTAVENGGAALGSALFEKTTGIKESDWKGKYWARWGDAVVEAGYKPNSFGQAIGDETLLTRLVEITAELGRFPTTDEIKLKRRTDTTFPSYEAFSRRWKKAEMPEAVLAFCTSKGGSNSVAAACREAMALQKTPKDEQAASAIGDFGWVYLMKSGRVYKIGRSAATGRRQYEVALQMPDRVELVHEFKTDDPVGIEQYWHKRFAHRRLNGEWFELTASEVAAFRRRKNFM